MVIQETHAVRCDAWLVKRLSEVVKRYQAESVLLASGAGHDAAVIARIAPVAMLFVRCKGGISHHPDESVKVDDVRVAIEVMNDLIRRWPS